MAGVPHVVATWWEILDEEAEAIAEAFYLGLNVEETQGMEIGRSAPALHKATLEARRKGIEIFVWASYAHFGA